MMEHLKRLGIGLACIVGFCACVIAFGLVWVLAIAWPIPAGIIIAVLLCWTIGTLWRGP